MLEKAKRLMKSIPRGKVVSYSELASALSVHPRLAGRLVSMNRDPEVPCHRVVGKDGSLVGYSLGSLEDKRKRLEEEGVVFRGSRVSDKCFHHFRK